MVLFLFTISQRDGGGGGGLGAGCRDGAVVSALAFYQCGPGSIPGLSVMCGLPSLLIVLVLAPRGFSPGIPVSSPKPIISKFQFDLENDPIL